MRLSVVAAGLVLLATPSAATLTRDPGWVADARTGCTIWNAIPAEHDSVTWSGECPSRLAQGPGIAQWFEDGKPSSRVEATFRDGRPEGSVVVTYPDGRRYTGELSDGRRTGHGVFTWPDGDRYEGGYRNDERDGQGTYTYANGDSYQGTYRDGKMDGKGVYTWADGDRYDGEYADDKRSGHGVYTHANGDRREGTWRNGKFVAADRASATIALATPTGSPTGSGTRVPQDASGRSEVRLRQEDGVLTIPVRINDAMTLDFTVDSGASDVSISADVVQRLMRAGALTKSDFLGKKDYELADGSTVRAETFRIRVLKVGDREIRNVTGSIADSGAGLLLGQTFLSRFKSWSIDNQRQVLVLE
jgi:clan AA aspartic protease (TIGR02281 family)